MRFLLILSLLCISAVASANPFERFVGKYVVTRSLESVCTFQKSECGFNDWNLNILNSVWIWKKDYQRTSTSPLQQVYGMQTVGGNSVLWQSLEEGLNGGGYEQKISSSADGTEAIMNEYFDRASSEYGITNRMTQMSDGTIQYTFERTARDSSYEKYVYQLAPAP